MKRRNIIMGDGTIRHNNEGIVRNNALRRSGSEERLQQLRSNAERERQSYLNDPTRIDPPTYGDANRADQAFPSLGVIDRLKNRPVNLSENNIMDTKNFILTQESNWKNFLIMYERAQV